MVRIWIMVKVSVTSGRGLDQLTVPTQEKVLERCQPVPLYCYCIDGRTLTLTLNSKYNSNPNPVINPNSDPKTNPKLKFGGVQMDILPVFPYYDRIY